MRTLLRLLSFSWLLRNARTTDSRIAAKSAEFLSCLLPRPAACALLRNTRTTDSRIAAKSAEFLSCLLPRPAACALLSGVAVCSPAVWMLALSWTLPPAICRAQISPNAAQDEARAVYVEGQVSRVSGEDLPWALSAGEHVPVHQIITTGPEGVARFEVQGGTSFEIFSQSRVAFRRNAASAGDLMDIEYGRAKISFIFGAERRSTVQRVKTPIVNITARANTSFTVLQQENQTTRIDVQAGEVFVQHLLLPRGDSIPVKAGDSIIVDRNEPLSRKMDRGTIYRYAFRSIIDAMGTYMGRRLPEHDPHFIERSDDNTILEARSAGSFSSGH